MKPSASFWKISGGMLGLAAFLAILIALNMILGSLRMRVDLTENKVYSLSQGTRSILKKLDSAVTLKFFFTSSAPEISGPIKLFAAEVERLLREYEIAGNGKLILEKYDPKPDSETEEWANRYGLFGQQLSMNGPSLYMGLVAVKGGSYESIPFFDPRKESLMEYDITRLIQRVSSQGKPAIGVISSLPILGTMPYSMPEQPHQKGSPAWIAFSELAQDYEVREIASDATELDDDIDVLLLVHPKNLSELTLYAIDQFVLRGGRLLAFLDPLCLAEARFPPSEEEMQRSAGPASDLLPLTEAWGIECSSKVLLDLSASTPIDQGMNRVEESPVFLTLRQENINKQNTATAQLNTLILACAGAFSYSEAEPVSGLKIEPILTSSTQSQLLDPMEAQMSSIQARVRFKSSNEQMPIALRLAGNFKTAFPDGSPSYDEESEPSAEEAEALEDGSLKESAEPTTVILVYDVDMLYDEFAVQELSFFGQRAYRPINDNIYFLVNAVEQLVGGAELADVRARARFERPFHRVLALQRKAQEQWMARELALQEKLDATRARLESLQSDRDKNQRFILSQEQQAEIERFRQEELKTQRELRDVRRNLREEIERLGVKLKALNILLIPALVCAAGITFSIYRRRKAEGQLSQTKSGAGSR